jgi:hypothetical protein
MMNAAMKKPEEQFDEVFANIAKLYDHAENILKIAYHESIIDQDKFLNEIDDLVKQIEESANIIAEDFGTTVESGEEPTNAMKLRVSTALRKVLNSIDDYKKLVTMQPN